FEGVSSQVWNCLVRTPFVSCFCYNKLLEMKMNYTTIHST
ncbi:hypothetical protein Tsubulata_044115, partial [Turnera subulata]